MLPCCHVSTHAAVTPGSQAATRSISNPSNGQSGASSKSNGSGSGSGYKQPPPEILQIVDAPPQPSLSFSPDRRLILQLQRPPSLPPISEIARPELKLAGGRGAGWLGVGYGRVGGRLAVDLLGWVGGCVWVGQGWQFGWCMPTAAV